MLELSKCRDNVLKKNGGGIALLFAPNIDYSPVKEERQGLWMLFIKLKRQWQLIINIVLAAMLITLISILGSYFLQAVIDNYIPNSLNNTLAIVASGLLILYVFNSMFNYARDFLLTILGQRLSIEIILGYIKHIFELPMEFFATRKTGEIVSRFE